MTEEPRTGGEPETFGRCVECGEVYPVQESDDGLRPVGTGGSCACGCEAFEPIAE
ncbi:hypothetical protein [Halopelagius longus]|uniref:Uncharacterized protein n=1 Tax=Halopelagius longus TaxID=1236180 RepID=A0A1H1AST7_9EURY|nr:hypothetical protein [Halopelagius longus]SDQ42798.1 hypothetical protein SAMN05216278_1478 [Halopelagius longus]